MRKNTVRGDGPAGATDKSKIRRGTKPIPEEATTDEPAAKNSSATGEDSKTSLQAQRRGSRPANIVTRPRRIS